MLSSHEQVRGRLRRVIADKDEQGHVVDGLAGELEDLPDDYQRLADFGHRLSDLPLKPDWPYVEPNRLDEILAEADSSRTRHAPTEVNHVDAERRARAGFLGSVCGCILGKPVEINPTLDELKRALQAIGEWPLNDYIPERISSQGGLRPLHRDWPETVRGRIRWVAPDDDINYTLLGLLVLEQHGISYTKADLKRLWLEQLPLAYTFGPERTTLVKLGASALDSTHECDDESLADVDNPGDELCGAMIRADAYGLACPGNPALAAELAWRDASLTHRRTGIYGTMFAAAAIAASYTVSDPLAIFDAALSFVPRRSRFHHIVADSLHQVASASDWEDGYRRIHDRYGQYAHCRVLQESGTLINTLRFAESVGHGICLQVSQGNDTDSYGATVGTLLGVRFGPDGLEGRWLEPFNDTIHTRLAGLYEHSLTALADRVGKLPALGISAVSR